MGFFDDVWDDISAPFKAAGDAFGCMTSWNSGEHLLFGSGRFPMLTADWWKTLSFESKFDQIETWWDKLGCMQKICYVAGMVIIAAGTGMIFFFLADSVLDVEDFGIFFTTFFQDAFDIFQMMFETSMYFTRMFLFDANPLFDLFNYVAESMDMTPILGYIATAELTMILAIPLMVYFYDHVIGPAEKAAPLMVKIFRIIDLPIHFLGEIVQSIFGTFGLIFLDSMFLPMRILIFIVSFAIGKGWELLT